MSRRSELLNAFPWATVIQAMVVGFIATATAAALIVELAPNPPGGTATLADWQLFLAVVFGLATGAAGLLTVARSRFSLEERREHAIEAGRASARALQWEERHFCKAQAKQMSRRGVDRMVAAAGLMADLQALVRQVVEAAKAAADPTGATPAPPPAAAGPLLPVSQSERLSLLGGRAINHVVRFDARLRHWQDVRNAGGGGEPGPHGRLARDAADLARLGFDALRHVATAAHLTDEDKGLILLGSAFHTLPDALLVRIEDKDNVYRPMINRLRRRHTEDFPGSPLPPLPEAREPPRPEPTE